MKLPRLQTVLMALGALLAVNLLIIGFDKSNREEGPKLPRVIKSVTPPPGSLIRLQDEVGVDLDDVYMGRLQINGIDIPEDQTLIYRGLGQVKFRPGQGKEIERLAEGRNSATVYYYPQDESRGEPERSYTWEFLAS